MKITKYFFGLALLAATATSCNSDNEGAIYQSSAANITFEQKEMAQVTTPEESITIPVRVIRGNKAEAATATYTTQANKDGIFTDDCNGTVNFAPGQSVAIINVTANHMVVGETYKYTITLSDATIALADKNLDNVVPSTSVNIFCDYEWVEAGTCTFIDYTFSEDEENGSKGENVPIIHGKGSNIYRIVAPFTKIDDYGDADSQAYFANVKYIEFTLNEDGSAKAVKTGQPLGAYKIAYLDQYPDFCYFLNEGNEFVISFFVQDGTSLYTGGLFEFIWDEWPGAE